MKIVGFTAHLNIFTYVCGGVAGHFDRFIDMF